MSLSITLTDALKQGACYSDKQIKTLFGKRKKLTVKQIAALPIPDEDKVWALTRFHFLDTKDKSVRFAIFCAESCINIFGKRYPNDKRPRQAIEAAKDYVENPTEENRKAADAAYSARAAAYSAAYAAAYSARAAADAAAYAAQLKFLVALLMEKKQ